MITIRCAIRRRIFRYAKMKKVRIFHCWKDRIERDLSVRDGDRVLCPCGNLIGVDQGRWIKLRQGAFTYTRTAMNS